MLARIRTETPDRSKSPAVVEDTITEVVRDLRREYGVRAVGVGAAGFVDEQRANVLFAPHLSWRREPLRDALSARLDLPVVVENDANASAWAEVRAGAGQGWATSSWSTWGPGSAARWCWTAACTAGATAWPVSSDT